MVALIAVVIILSHVVITTARAKATAAAAAFVVDIVICSVNRTIIIKIGARTAYTNITIYISTVIMFIEYVVNSVLQEQV